MRADDVLIIGAGLAVTLCALCRLNLDLQQPLAAIGQSRQVAMVHALLNVLGLSFSTASLALRRNGRRRLARAPSATGYLISASAAHLGGKLSFGLGNRFNRTIGETMLDSFVPVLDAAELLSGSP